MSQPPIVPARHKPTSLKQRSGDKFMSAASSLTSSRFNAEDADLSFRSSDGILFKIHSKNLRCSSGIFAAGELRPAAQEEIRDTKEPAYIWELVFQFIYPNPQPDLSELEVPILLEFAHLVSQLQLYSAIPICNMVLAQTLPKAAAEILQYALKFQYTKLMNVAAPHVTPSAIADMAPKASGSFNRTWLLYWSSRSKAFSKVYTTCPESCSRATSASPSGIKCGTWNPFMTSTLIKISKLSGMGSTSLENIASIIAIRDPVCCRLAAEKWKGEVDRALAGCGSFNELIRSEDREPGCVCM